MKKLFVVLMLLSTAAVARHGHGRHGHHGTDRAPQTLRDCEYFTGDRLTKCTAEVTNRKLNRILVLLENDYGSQPPVEPNIVTIQISGNDNRGCNGTEYGINVVPVSLNIQDFMATERTINQCLP